VDLQALWLTLKLAALTTAILAAVGLPLAYWLTVTRIPGKWLIESVVALPLLLPPTVLGFYVLWATGPRSPMGTGYARLTGSGLPFTFAGILLASVLFNLPFAVRPFVAAFSTVDRRLVEAAWCLGASRFRTFWRITLPLASAGVLTGLVLTFAHTIGEFGVVLMVGGNIPGVTRTLSISIYDDVQALDYARANQTALVLIVFAFAVLALVHALHRRTLSL
jgi:molybdate transport system permease protein